MPPVRLRYQTIEFGDVDIHVRSLRDNQQFSDDDKVAEKLGISSALWPLFGVIWPSSIILANCLSTHDIKGKRILEVGCGIGLTSLVLNHRHADITASDIHPEAEAFLLENTVLNKGKLIPFKRSDWQDLDSTLGKFDLIVGSDLLYEKEHASLLSQFIDLHATDRCEVIIVDPGRGLETKFTHMMTALGYTHQQNSDYSHQSVDGSYKGRVHFYHKH